MTLNHNEKMKLGNLWCEIIKEKGSTHIEELREFAQLKAGKLHSEAEFYSFKKFFEWKWKNLIKYNKTEKIYEAKIIELDEDEAKQLV